jgi:hypothetical protein
LGCLVGSVTVGVLVLAHILYKLGLVSDSSWNIHDRPALTLGVLLVVVGIQFFSIGLLGELLITELGSRAGHEGYSIKQIREES